jgi:hypothetical protein
MGAAMMGTAAAAAGRRAQATATANLLPPTPTDADYDGCIEMLTLCDAPWIRDSRPRATWELDVELIPPWRWTNNGHRRPQGGSTDAEIDPDG